MTTLREREKYGILYEDFNEVKADLRMAVLALNDAAERVDSVIHMALKSDPDFPIPHIWGAAAALMLMATEGLERCLFVANKHYGISVTEGTRMEFQELIKERDGNDS